MPCSSAGYPDHTPARLSLATRLLCTTLKALDAPFRAYLLTKDPELKQWWDQHQLIDEQKALRDRLTELRATAKECQAKMDDPATPPAAGLAYSQQRVDALATVASLLDRSAALTKQINDLELVK